MNLSIVMPFIVVFILAALFMLCACRVASISDRQDEALFKKWLLEHEKEAKA